MSSLLLILSVILSCVRNILSKENSDLVFGTKQFFITQAIIFMCGSAALILVADNSFYNISLLTFFYAMIYSLLLLSAQYCYTAALKNGNIGICSTVYSLGFIFPTLSGSIFWSEVLTAFDFLGVLLVIITIVFSGMLTFENKKRQSANRYIYPLILAMISSGGLGIMQKVQQHSPYPDERESFIIFAFALAGIISFVLSLFAKKHRKINFKRVLAAMGAGGAFSFSNLLNTILAGQLDSTVFFPILNIGTILFSIVAGTIFYKEKISKKDLVILIMGIASIVLITVM